MESTKLSALLVLAMLALSSSPIVLACNSCGSGSTPSSDTPSTGAPSIGGIVGAIPPVIGGIVGKVAPVAGGVVSGATPVAGGVVGAVTPVVGGVAPVAGGIVGTVGPIVGGIVGGGSPVRHGGRKACPPSPTPPTPTPPTPTPTPPSSDTCPIDALKLGVCVDLLGNDVHIGDTHVQCCPLLKGVAGLSAAACLCTTIKAKVLDISVYVPLALQLLLNCGCAVPPGYNCA